MVTQAEVQGWAGGLAAVLERIGPRFGRAEPRRRAAAYLRGLLAPIERKNGWQLAEAAGDATPDGVQDFLSRAQWDADAVRDDLQAYVAAHLGDVGAVLVLDETGFIKKGKKSAGVQRQYSGAAGRIENSQIGVFLGYASRYGHALLDRALYLPREWAAGADQRREARIPEAVAFATKPKLGLAMLERAQAAGVPFSWVVGDSVYGADHTIRRWAERHRCGYVLAVTSGQRLGLRPVTTWIKGLPKRTWQRLSAGDGAKGPRLYDWACLPYSGAAPGFQCALLVRRSIAKPQELAFYLTHAPEDTSLDELVRTAGTRWSIESLFEQAKGEVGLGHYEVRSWVGWHRHVTLAMLALAYLAAVRRAAAGGCDPGEPGRCPAAAHGARDQAPALASDLDSPAQTRGRPALVSMAPPSPAAPPSRSLAQTAALHTALT
ncbi:MAG: IS701 family transposase [Candidatus Dormibacteria bacterium]